MLPSPCLPATNNNKTKKTPQLQDTSPKPILPSHQFPLADAAEFEIDHSILLTPPTGDVLDPFDNPARNSTTGLTSDTDTVINRNHDAFHQNTAFTQRKRDTSVGDNVKTNRLQIQTDLPGHEQPRRQASLESDPGLRQSASSMSIPKRTPSIRAALHTTAGSLSPGSTLSSPQLAAMLNITPLPSPIEAGKDPWRSHGRTRSRGSSLLNAETTPPSPTLPPQAPADRAPPSASPPKPKQYDALRSQNKVSRPDSSSSTDSSSAERDRSVTDYLPDSQPNIRPRKVAVSSTLPPAQSPLSPSALHREEYLALQRGFLSPSSILKSPHISAREDSPPVTQTASEQEDVSDKIKEKYCTAQSVQTGQSVRYRLLRILGQGTFSKVFLAVRQVVDHGTDDVDYASSSSDLKGVRARSQRSVAIKVVAKGPAGGADSHRIETSLQRELDILKSIHHPSLVELKAFGTEKGRSLLVLNYCPGGDLFEVASSQADILGSSLVRRIFAELISAVRYLHQQYIVHRDIKLESKSATSSLAGLAGSLASLTCWL